MKCQDPALCLDIIDDMYEIYFEIEVRIYFLNFEIVFNSHSCGIQGQIYGEGIHEYTKGYQCKDAKHFG